MKKQMLYLAASLILAAGTAYAGCVDTFGIGAKASAMGGAYSAYADDPFAVYYNPAGLTQIDRATLAAGFHMIDPTIKLKNVYVEGTSNPDFPRTKEEAIRFSDTSDDLYAPAIGFAMPVTDKIFMGIAAYAPFGLEVEFPSDVKKNPTAYSSFHSYYVREAVTPSIAYKINDHFSLGFGISIGKSKAGAEKLYYTGGAKNASSLSPEQKALDGAHLKLKLEDDINYSFNLGLMYNYNERLSVGLTYRSETDADFEGDAYVNGRKVAKAKLDYNHPQQVQAGVRYRPHQQFSVQMDIVWTNWSINKVQHETLRGIGVLDLEAIGISSISNQRRWDNTRQMRFGAEYIANDLLTLRAGYFYDPSPIPDDTLDTMWPDADKKTYSIGAGFNLSNFTLDLVFQYTDIEQTRIVGGESENLNNAVSGISDLRENARMHAKAGGHLLGAGATLSYKF